jgi:hypothetical protein
VITPLVDLLRKFFGTPIERIEPGVDPTDKPVKPRARLPWGTIIIGVLFFGVIGARALSAKAAQPAPEDGSQATAAATLAATLTATPTASPTVTATGILEDFAHTYRTPGATAAALDCAPAQDAPVIVITKVVQAPAPLCPAAQQVTVEVPVVITHVVTQMATIVISATPEPTQTPWVIVVEVTREVTATATATATPSPTPEPPTPTATGILETLVP